jgi:hypothetical protein
MLEVGGWFVRYGQGLCAQCVVEVQSALKDGAIMALEE